MHTINGRIKSEENKCPDKWTELRLWGIDHGPHSPEFLGYLTDDEGIWTHIVTKMRGYSWYYNQYHPMQYSGVAVEIYRIESLTYNEEKGEYEFILRMPWSEEFQKPRKK